MTLTHCTLSGKQRFELAAVIYNFNFNGTAPGGVRNSIFNTGDSG
jgi:hypothetical protein